MTFNLETRVLSPIHLLTSGPGERNENTWGIRLVTVKNYLVFYVISEENKRVCIIRFLHSKQNWNAVLSKGFSLE